MLQPSEQAFMALVIAVFVIFSAILAYATYLGGEPRTPKKTKKN